MRNAFFDPMLVRLWCWCLKLSSGPVRQISSDAGVTSVLVFKKSTNLIVNFHLKTMSAITLLLPLDNYYFYFISTVENNYFISRGY